MFSSTSTASSSEGSYCQASGRFAFPPGTVLTPEQRLRVLEQFACARREAEAQRIHEEMAAEEEAERENLAKEQVWQDYLKAQEERRRRLEEREHEEALKGEKHWVSQGGILRDADGRRDYKRTEEIRKIVEKEEAERRIMERWKAYENAWTNITSSTDKPVAFNEMPWPLASRPKHADELRNPVKIAEFLFESLSLEQNKTTRRERLRTSLLRWHPDKLHSLLARVPESDVDAVKDGIDAVVISLMKLQEAEKAK